MSLRSSPEGSKSQILPRRPRPRMMEMVSLKHHEGLPREPSWRNAAVRHKSASMKSKKDASKSDAECSLAGTGRRVGSCGGEGGPDQ